MVENKKPLKLEDDFAEDKKKKPDMVMREILLVNNDKKTGNVHWFKKPPNAFSYFTSITRRGILKSINKVNPPILRNGNKISMDQINLENNGMYNF